MSIGGGPTPATTRPPWALGTCDICGFTGKYKLNELKVYIYDRRPNGLLVCPDCWDEDNPQLWLGEVRVNDPQSLYDPRPDTGRQGSTTLFGWMPIGNPLTNIQCYVGDLEVTIT